jgi:hypothetical protein
MARRAARRLRVMWRELKFEWYILENRWCLLLDAPWLQAVRERAFTFVSFFVTFLVYIGSLVGFLALLPLMTPVQAFFGVCLLMAALATLACYSGRDR